MGGRSKKNKKKPESSTSGPTPSPSSSPADQNSSIAMTDLPPEPDGGITRAYLDEVVKTITAHFDTVLKAQREELHAGFNETVVKMEATIEALTLQINNHKKKEEELTAEVSKLRKEENALEKHVESLESNISKIEERIEERTNRQLCKILSSEEFQKSRQLGDPPPTILVN